MGNPWVSKGSPTQINAAGIWVTLDTFRFLVGGRLAARQAISWPRLPKVALLGPKMQFFGPKSIFCDQPQKTLPEAQQTQGIASLT